MCIFTRWGGLFCLASFAAFAQTPVFLISVDTLRADHLGIYGYRRISTPNIDSFARQGTAFDAIDCQIPLTLPSHAVLFTSTYPFRNRVEENEGQLPAGVPTLASVLRAHGYKTAAFVGSVLLGPHLGLEQGFDFYDSPFTLSPDAAQNPLATGIRRDGALVVRAARQWLIQNHGQPVFAFLHFFDLHAPYSHSSSGNGLPNQAGYDAEIEYVDRLIGQFQRVLMAGDWWDRSLVVLLSDHGESLGEHGESNHGYFIYQSTVRVPLLIHWPAGTGRSAPRVAQPAGLVDVAPTILDFLKLAAPPAFAGSSLLPATRSGKDDAREVYAESVYARDAFRWAPLRSIRQGNYQFIDAPRPELYDLAHDPGEQRNLAGQEGALLRKLRGQLAQLMAQNGGPGPAAAPSTPGASAGKRQMLDSLGYVGGGGNSGSPAADPKDKLAEYNLYETALGALFSGQAREAVAAFHRVLSGDPSNSMARYYLGDAYLRSGDSQSALREWDRDLKIDPGYAPAAEALGAWWMGREDYTKARAYFQKALAAVPQDYPALLEQGVAEERLGLLREAHDHIAVACRSLESNQCARELHALEEKTKTR